jgi:hypothetical protein
LHAETKIAMLRLFCDCIDLASPESDGWIVHDWLKRAYAREKVPISQNSIIWLLHMTAKEEYVECRPRQMWCALQHAVRSILNHERHSRYLEGILQLSKTEHMNITQQSIDMLGFWIALRVAGRALLHMILQIGSLLQMRGFDWVEDHMPRRDYLKVQPSLYTAWCNAVLDAVEKLREYMRQELDLCMQQFGWARSDLISAISCTDTTNRTNEGSRQETCTSCESNYGELACSLVEPARISITECVKTGHHFNCLCQSIPTILNLPAELPTYTGTYHSGHETDDVDTTQDFFDAQPYVFPASSPSHHPTPTMFSDMATLLYSAQGRNWVSNYAIGERLCSICFLRREQYIGADGLAAEFPPMPRSFDGLREFPSDDGAVRS